MTNTKVRDEAAHAFAMDDDKWPKSGPENSFKKGWDQSLRKAPEVLALVSALENAQCIIHSHYCVSDILHNDACIEIQTVLDACRSHVSQGENEK